MVVFVVGVVLGGVVLVVVVVLGGVVVDVVRFGVVGGAVVEGAVLAVGGSERMVVVREVEAVPPGPAVGSGSWDEPQAPAARVTARSPTRRGPRIRRVRRVL